MLQNWLFPQLQPDSGFIFQQDGAPPHCAREFRRFFNKELPQRCCRPADLVLHHWPPMSPDLTVCDFFRGGQSKTKRLHNLTACYKFICRIEICHGKFLIWLTLHFQSMHVYIVLFRGNECEQISRIFRRVENNQKTIIEI